MKIVNTWKSCNFYSQYGRGMAMGSTVRSSLLAFFDLGFYRCSLFADFHSIMLFSRALQYWKPIKRKSHWIFRLVLISLQLASAAIFGHQPSLFINTAIMFVLLEEHVIKKPICWHIFISISIEVVWRDLISFNLAFLIKIQPIRIIQWLYSVWEDLQFRVVQVTTA